MSTVMTTAQSATTRLVATVFRSDRFFHAAACQSLVQPVNGKHVVILFTRTVQLTTQPA
jgi:hypothetical protein